MIVGRALQRATRRSDPEATQSIPRTGGDPASHRDEPNAPASGLADEALRRPTRVILGSVVGLAGVIHAALTPAHFSERAAYGVFFVGAAGFQVTVAAVLLRRRAPAQQVYAIALWGSLALIALWIVTRAVAPPLGDAPEEVSAAGVAATGLELAALIGLAVAMPRRQFAATRNRSRVAAAWGIIAGLAFALLFALASSTAVYQTKALPQSLTVPSVTVYGRSLGTQSPWVQLLLTRHLYLHGAASTLAFLVASAVLLGLATGLAVAVGRRAPACAPSRARWGGLAPSFLAVPSCCAAPLAGFLGTSAITPLLAVTPWVLAATTLFLAVQVAALMRRYRAVR